RSKARMRRRNLLSMHRLIAEQRAHDDLDNAALAAWIWDRFPRSRTWSPINCASGSIFHWMILPPVSLFISWTASLTKPYISTNLRRISARPICENSNKPRPTRRKLSGQQTPDDFQHD